MTAEVLAYRCDAQHARELTEQIRSGVERVHQLLVRSYEWEAWRALGYPSWRDYATAEFGLSKSHAYRLLDQARVIQEIEAVAAVSPIGELPEAVVRELAPIVRDHGAEVAAEVLQQTAAEGPVTAKAIRATAEDAGHIRISKTTAETVEQVVDTNTGETAPIQPRAHRKPLPDAFFERSHDLARVARSLHNLITDDRWSRNAEQVTRYRNDLLRTRDLIDQVIAALPNPQEG